MSTAPACDRGQLFVGFERRGLVILCGLTRLKTSKLSLIKLGRVYAFVSPDLNCDHKDCWPEFCS